MKTKTRDRPSGYVYAPYIPFYEVSSKTLEEFVSLSQSTRYAGTAINQELYTSGRIMKEDTVMDTKIKTPFGELDKTQAALLGFAVVGLICAGFAVKKSNKKIGISNLIRKFLGNFFFWPLIVSTNLLADLMDDRKRLSR